LPLHGAKACREALMLAVIYQKTIITFAELTIIRFLMILGILPNSSGLLEKS
jgi:hypothetical protein